MDDRALESLPLKLSIVAVVASMSVLPAAKALDGLETREFVKRVEMQLDRVVTAAQILTVQGPGNVRTLSLDFRSAANIAFEQLRVGDRPDGPNSSSASVLLNNGGIMTRIATDPGCVICSENRTAFVAGQPEFGLRMTAVLDNRTIIVLVEMV